jgi:hypothetical protein
MLRLPPNKRCLHFGYPIEPQHIPTHLSRWVLNCNEMSAARSCRQLKMLEYLGRLAARIEIRQKFKDWCLVARCRRLRRYHLLLKSWKLWKLLSHLQRLVTCTNLLINTRSAFAIWIEFMLLRRGYDFMSKKYALRAFRQWSNNVLELRRLRMCRYLSHLREHTKLSKILNKIMVDLTVIFYIFLMLDSCFCL